MRDPISTQAREIASSVQERVFLAADGGEPVGQALSRIVGAESPGWRTALDAETFHHVLFLACRSVDLEERLKAHRQARKWWRR